MRYALTIFFIAIINIALSQKLEVTPKGLKDAENIDKSYIVLNIEETPADKLYNNAFKYISKNYRNPEKVIKAKIENEYLKFGTHESEFLIINNSGAKIPIKANYTIELSFKDNKVKFEINELSMPAKRGGYNVLFSGGAFSGYPIYNKKGDLKRTDTKKEIEVYFNSQILSLKEYLKGETDDNNW